MTGELFYIFVNQVSERERERRTPSSSSTKESNLAFMAMVIGRILWGSLYYYFFLIHLAVQGLGC